MIYTHSHYHSLSRSHLLWRRLSLGSNENIPGATGNRKTFLFAPDSLVIKERFTQWDALQFGLTMSEIIPNKPSVFPSWSCPESAGRVHSVGASLIPSVALYCSPDNPTILSLAPLLTGGFVVFRCLFCVWLGLISNPLFVCAMFESMLAPQTSSGCFKKRESCTYVAAHSLCTPSTPCYEKYKADSLETSHHQQPKTTCVQLLRHPTILSLAPTTTKQVRNETV